MSNPMPAPGPVPTSQPKEPASRLGVLMAGSSTKSARVPPMISGRIWWSEIGVHQNVTFPVAGEMMYVQPVYALRESGEGAYPVLQFVLASFGKGAGYVRRQVEEALTSDRAGSEVSTPAGPMTLADHIDQVVSDDLVLHGWDLAVAIGNSGDASAVEGLREHAEGTCTDPLNVRYASLS